MLDISVNYDNWKSELIERRGELMTISIWLGLFLIGVDKKAREDGKLELDLPEEYVERVNAWYKMLNELIHDMEKSAIQKWKKI